MLLAAQAEILAATLLHPDREITITELSRLLGIPLATVSDEVARLLDAQILNARQSAAPNPSAPIRITDSSPR